MESKAAFAKERKKVQINISVPECSIYLSEHFHELKFNYYDIFMRKKVSQTIALKDFRAKS